MAAVALFSMSSYAQTTTEAEGTTTTTEELTPVEMWAKVSATNPLHYFDRVTVVDEDENVAYADDGTKQIEPVPFKTETGGTALPQNASYFYVAEGSSTSFFALNKTLSKKEGKFVNSAGEVVDVPEDGAPTEGALGSGAYMDEDGNLVYPSDLVDEVSWNWEEMSSDYYLFTASNRSRFAYYNKAAKRFKTTTTETATKAKLYKVVTVYAPYFKDPEGPQKLENEDDTYKAEIINPNEGGELKYRFEGEDDTKWKIYPDGGIECETGEETTIETKIDFEGGSTPVVGRTFVPVYVPAPEITAELEKDGTLKIGVDGTAPVTITSEEGTSLTYSVGTGKAKEIESNEVEVDLAYIADQTPNTTPVTGMAIKEVEYTPWPTKDKDGNPSSKATGTVKSDPTTENFTVVKYADAQDVFTEFKAYKEPESKVDLGETIQLWFELKKDCPEGYEIAANDEDNKTLDLTFENGDEVTVDLILNEETGRMEFIVPTDEKYANSYFTFDVPEGFYFAYTNGDPECNKVETAEVKDVKYYTGVFAAHYILDCDLALDNVPPVRSKYLTTDDVYVDFQIYLNSTEQDVEVDFSEEALALQKTDPTLGVKFTDELNHPVTAVERVEKVEGTPNIFRVFFVNEDSKDTFVEKALKDEQIVQKGYILGFAEGTFVSGDSKNKDELSAHIFFTEAVELTMKPVRDFVCEGVEGVAVKVTAKGKVLGTDYNTPYWLDKEKTVKNPAESQVELTDGVEVVITGTDIHGDAVEVIAKLQKEFPDRPTFKHVYSNYNSKDLFYLNWGQYEEQIAESEDGIAEFVLQEDSKMKGGDDYTVTVPAGAFIINNCESAGFTDKLDVLAHPVWEFAARPYTFDEDGEVKTLVIDGKATLDDLIEGNADEDKFFEKDVRKYLSNVAITVDKQEITEWAVKEVSKPAQDENGRWYETFVVEIPLNEAITDVEVHQVVIKAHALIANACDNKEQKLNVYPEVKYGIQQVTYCITTAVPSVTYYIWAELPDGSYLNEPIQYVGETGEDKTEMNAAALNNAKNATTETAKYPVIEPATEVGEFDEHPATLFTVKFPAGLLKPWVAKMTFPVGTVQADGYVPNDEDLWNNITIIPDIEFDATSSLADFLTPNKADKEKVYNIPTSQKTIRLYLTGWNKYNNVNANKQVQLLGDDDDLLISEKAGVALTWKAVSIAGGYTAYDVTFVDEKGEATGLQEGSYTLTVQEHHVINTNYDPTCDPKINCDNQDAFELTINVEDFAEDAEVEITTKTYDFDVPVSDGPITVKEGATATLNGKTVQLSTIHEGEIRVTLLGDPDATAYDFIQKPGTYTFEIPANTFEGEYAPCTVAIPVTVDVVFEFVDSNTKTDNFGNDLVTTKEEVLAAKGVQKKMYYTRNFKSTRLQMLAVPFDIAKDEVDFSIARINAVTIDDATEELKANFVYINGEDATAYANKPYAIKPAAEGLVKYTFENKEVFEAKVAEGEDAIRCSTTKVRFDFKNTIEETTGDFLTLGKTEDGTAGIGVATELPAWRWYVETSDKTVKYVKVAINGVDVDATGIDFVEAAEGDNLIFNVAGQKLNTAAKGKVNIINGKKVFVK